MGSSGLNAQTYRIMTKRNRNNEPLIQHLTAITCSLCCTRYGEFNNNFKLKYK